MLSSVDAVLRLHLSWGCDNFLLPAPQNDLTKPGIVKNKQKQKKLWCQQSQSSRAQIRKEYYTSKLNKLYHEQSFFLVKESFSGLKSKWRVYWRGSAK